MSEVWAVVMAGGSGTRFWPLSRRDRPKQFLAIGGDRPLLRETVDRLAPLIGLERTLVVAGEGHVAPIRAVLPDLPAEHLVVEPCARNTAPCIGLAAVHLERVAGRDAVMVVLPADHHIADRAGFRRLLAVAAERARAGEIVTLGIRPTRPETGYGYIRIARGDTVDVDGVAVSAVDRFVEKPPRELAEQYLADGLHLWNSGVFVFTVGRILDELGRYLPEAADALARIGAAASGPEARAVLVREYAAMRSVSIDHGVMEHADRRRVVPADIGWSDVGHWAAIGEMVRTDALGNAVVGEAVLVDAERTVVHAEPGHLVAVVGASDLVVVVTDDAVLVCPRDRAQDVRAVVDALAERGRSDLL